jgi:hypothetical protein
MSWYEYSRHATSVLVHYLRSYDHILQRLDERKLLDALSLKRLVAFTNALYDEWPLRKPDSSEAHPLNAIRIPEFPISDIVFGTSSVSWFMGTTAECEMSDSTRSILEDVRRRGEDLMTEVPLSLRSTNKGYRFTMTFPEGERAIEVHLRNGNKPVLQGTLVPELWRAGSNRDKSRSGTERTRGKKLLLQNLHCHLSCYSEPMNSSDLLSTDIALTERMMYIALDTWFLQEHFAMQLQQARHHIEKRMEALRRDLCLHSVRRGE